MPIRILDYINDGNGLLILDVGGNFLGRVPCAAKIHQMNDPFANSRKSLEYITKRELRQFHERDSSHLIIWPA